MGAVIPSSGWSGSSRSSSSSARFKPRVPQDLPQMPIWIAKVAGVDSPGPVMCLVCERRPGCLGLGKYSVDLGPARDCLADAELTGLRWAELDTGILRQLRAGVEGEQQTAL